MIGRVWWVTLHVALPLLGMLALVIVWGSR